MPIFGAQPTFIIAEAGVNHNGSLDLALRLVETAAESGADAVKFQTFRADRLARRDAPKAAYQVSQTAASESQFDMLHRLELDEAAHRRLAERCQKLNIEFMSTAFDEESLALLLSLGIRRIKVPSGEITNGPLLLEMGRAGLPVILSTGMARLEEISDALAVLAWGMTRSERPTGLAALREHGKSDTARQRLGELVSILQCTTAYPAPAEAINLRAMDTLRQSFGLPVGLSDHSTGLAVPMAAVGCGATIIEKHFTLDRTMPGPDHAASLEPHELTAMVRGIREVELALGDGVKQPSPHEEPNIRIARRGLVAATRIPRGTPLTEALLTSMRPADGASPMLFWDQLGQPAETDLEAGMPIKANRY